MRKAILWILIALMALSGAACAENSVLVQPAQATAAVSAVPAENGMSAVRTASEVYMVIPSGAGEMLVRVPLNGGAPVSIKALSEKHNIPEETDNLQ